MITGAVLIVVGLLVGLSGSTRFNFGVMVAGWGMAFIGAAVFLTRLLSLRDV
jgi:hypothetical protein